MWRRLSWFMFTCATIDLALATHGVVEVSERAPTVAGMTPETRCESSLTAVAQLPERVPPGGLRFQVCRGDDCDRYDLAGAPLAFTTSTVCSGACYVGDGVIQVSRWFDEPSQLAPGETYDVRLFDPLSQRTYAASHGRAVYVPVDGSAICRSGEVTARPLAAGP